MTGRHFSASIVGMKAFILAAATMVAFAEDASSESKAVFGELVPLIEAVRNADRAGVEAALDGGAQVAQADALGRTALHYAAALGQNDILSHLLETSVEPDLRDGEGITPLMRAAQNGHAVAVKALLASGANAELRDNDGRSAVSFAAAHPEILALLEFSGD